MCCANSAAASGTLRAAGVQPVDLSATAALKSLLLNRRDQQETLSYLMSNGLDAVDNTSSVEAVNT